MTATTGNLFTRDDTMFGVCEALGEDLRFHPNYLRVILAVLLLWNPTVVVAAYVGAALLVLATRLIWPSRRTRQAAVDPQPVQHGLGDVGAEEPDYALPLAA